MNKLTMLFLTLSLACAGAAPALAQYEMIPTPTTAAPITPTQGWWYNQAEGGSGYGIAINGAGHIFFGAYGYSNTGSGAADWVVATLTQSSTNVYFGQLLHCTGGQMLSSPTFVAANCTSTGQQTMQLTFTDANTAMLQFSGGRTTQIQPFNSY